MRMPKGKGWYIWQALADPVAAATLARAAGISHVLFKICDGTIRYPFAGPFPVDPLPVSVATFKAHGIDVWGWGYVYGTYPEREADIAVERALELGVTGFVVNAEAQYKRYPDRHLRARAYMARLRSGLGADFPLGLSSYRFPSYHPELPWYEFLSSVDFNMPQVYWMQAHNAGAQLKRTVQEFSTMAVKRPIIPTGAAFKEHGWRAEPLEVLEFLQTAQELCVPGVNFWEWSLARRDLPACWDVIAQFPWGTTPPEPPPDPELSGTPLRVIASALNVRTGPGVGYPIVGSLHAGDIVEILGVGGIDAWVEFEPGRYAAVRIGGKTYMERV